MKNKFKKVRTWAEAIKDPRVIDYSDERSNGDGVWLYLKPNCPDTEFDPFQLTWTIHENTIGKALERLNAVRCRKYSEVIKLA